MTAPITHPLVADWTRDPRAVVILASIKAHPPKCEERRDVYAITADEWSKYTGYRVDCLDRIYGEHFARVHYNRGPFDSWADFDEFMGQPTVQDAIDQALNPEPEPVDFWRDVFLAFRPSPVSVRL